jgi:ribosome biogenesis GTPase
MQSDCTLDQLGWSEFFQHQLDAQSSLVPARVIAAHGESWEVLSPCGPSIATPSGQLRFAGALWPAVGDWVLLQAAEASTCATIVRVLERRTVLARQAAGRRTERQIIASNVDDVLVVTSFGPDFSLARLERYLSAICSGGARASVVLSKLDLCASPEATISEAKGVAGDVPVVTTSAQSGHGLDELSAYDRPGRTLVFIGSSGVGKSSLLNALLKTDAQRVRPVRDQDGTGRHTTTVRQMFALPGGGLVIDTPGLREVGLWSDEETTPAAFADIEVLAAHCRFADCGHAAEPGCAVQAAIERGELDERRLQSRNKLARELAHLAERHDKGAQLNRKRRWRARTKENRRRKRILGR